MNIIVLMVIVGCTCGFISIFMPHSLSGSLNKDLNEKALQLVDFLKDYTLGVSDLFFHFHHCELFIFQIPYQTGNVFK